MYCDDCGNPLQCRPGGGGLHDFDCPKCSPELFEEIKPEVSMKINFGMYEMEKAAERILEKYPTPSSGDCVCIENMQTDDERTGFVELMDNDWLTSIRPARKENRYNGEFFLTSAFVVRIESCKEESQSGS